MVPVDKFSLNKNQNTSKPNNKKDPESGNGNDNECNINEQETYNNFDWNEEDSGKGNNNKDKIIKISKTKNKNSDIEFKEKLNNKMISTVKKIEIDNSEKNDKLNDNEINSNKEKNTNNSNSIDCIQSKTSEIKDNLIKNNDNNNEIYLREKESFELSRFETEKDFDKFMKLKNLYTEPNVTVPMCNNCKEFLNKNNKIMEWDEIRKIISKYYLKENPIKMLFGDTKSDLMETLSNRAEPEKINFEEEEKRNVSVQGRCNIF